MLVDKSRMKLIHAIIFFVTHTNKCFKVKLFKLLYFLDFQHYQDVGRSVTNLEYCAWKMGPVPVELFNQIKNEDPELVQHIEISKEKFAGGQKELLRITPRFQFDPKVFSKRELKIMSDLAEKHKNHDADQMIEETHLENLPWHQVYNIEGRRQKQIPYEYALRKSEKELMNKLAAEHIEMKENYDKAGNGSFRPELPF